VKKRLVLSILPAVFLGAAQGARLPDAPVADPTAVATIAEANYCFGRVRGLDPGRLPPAYLVLQLRVKVAYRNSGTRPLILPLQHDRTIYTALKPGAMTVFHEAKGLFDPAYKKPMTGLPSNVSPVDPLEPKNDYFTVIPAGGAMSPPLLESMTMPVNRKFLFKPELDLRGHKVYFVMQFAHRELSPALEADLSDRWSRFGVPWTGVLRTNAFAIDIPAEPKAEACDDSQSTLR
jgi:hypothetical protein